MTEKNVKNTQSNLKKREKITSKCLKKREKILTRYIIRRKIYQIKCKLNIQSKSLNGYIKRFNPKYAIQISSKNFGFENGIKSVPLYAAFLIK